MIHGALVTIRPALEQDRRAVYEWMAHSEITPSMMGPPIYVEAPIPTWQEFCDDYVMLFFDGSQPNVGRSFIIEVAGHAIGHASYSQVDRNKKCAEIDIWLRAEALCGKGYGTDALVALTHHLHETLGLTNFIIRPSQRNERAIKSYAKAGFVLLPLTTAQQAALYGETEHTDTVAMCRKIG
jgi:diamine N-acetyltransferase